MTTSNVAAGLTTGPRGNPLAAAEAAAAQAAGVFDPALIAQWANRFFSAPPGTDPLPDTTAVPAVAQARVPSLQYGSQGAIAPNVDAAPSQEHRPSPFKGEVGRGMGEIPNAAEYPNRALLPHPLPSPPLEGEGADLASVPLSLGGVMSLVRVDAVPASASSGGFYFIDEALAFAGGAARPFEVSSLAPLATRSVEHRPYDVPDLGFGARPFNPHLVRRDFPILNEKVHGRPLVWLDNAATTQKPQAVIDRISYFYEHENSNIHRAAHALAARATDAYEAAREKVRRFINAGSTEEVIFVRGTTEAINLVAQSWGRRNVEAGDEIIVSALEHHANIVPWQQLAAEKGARLRVAPVDDNGDILLDEYEKLFNSRTKIAAFTQVSNALGTVTPAKEMVDIAHRHGVVALVDGAQSVSHMRTDVQALDADFFVFSGHKVFGPTGIGVVYGKKAILDATPPWQGGGNMIADVTFEKTVYQPAPWKFEAGTGNIADAVGLGAALDYVSSLGIEAIHAYERELIGYATRGLRTIPGLTIIGNPREKAGVISFVLDGFRTEEVGAALDKEGIAVRSGHHCAQPILRRFGIEASVRPSFAPYNTCEDIDALVAAVRRIQASGAKR